MRLFTYLFFVTFLVTIFIGGCNSPEENEKKVVQVKLFLNHGIESNRVSKTNEKLTEGIGTELIGVIPSGQGFNQNYKEVFYMRSRLVIEQQNEI